MKTAAVMLAVITTTGLSVAFADPPTTPPSGSTAAQTPATAPTPAAEPTPASAPPTAAAPATPAASTPADASTPPTPSAKPAPSASDDGITERQLRNQGYKLSMVHGNEKYCRREAPIGSRLESVMHCVTVAEAEAMAREGRETTERLQQHMPGCLPTAQGGCGH